MSNKEMLLKIKLEIENLIDKASETGRKEYIKALVDVKNILWWEMKDLEA
jgi:hypothetical protein